MNTLSFDIIKIAAEFSIPGEFVSISCIEAGHINNTYAVCFNDNGKETTYLLQQININVFKNPDELMSNITAVTDFLRKKIEADNGDTDRETLRFFNALNGKYYYCDNEGRYWRICNFVTDSYSTDFIDKPETYYNAGAAFGIFQKRLEDFPSSTLFETIPDFHNTAKRFDALCEAINKNIAGRLDSVKEEVEFALSNKDTAYYLVDMVKSGALPIRVTHNDTKLNNVLFDSNTKKALCIIDLDTVMPGLSLYDFGDSIRFAANTAAEDEKDLSKVSLNLELFEAYVKGYLSTAGESLTRKEIELLPFSAKLMTYECGIRFLTDYLNGDTYFKISYPEHNLDRCRTQFELIKDIDKKMDTMLELTLSAIEG